MTDLYIALVSDQLLPNLIPALMEKPLRILLVSSDDMASKGVSQRLEKILKNNGMKVEVLTGLPSAGLERIRDFALELASELTDTAITLNATGGSNELGNLGWSYTIVPEARLATAENLFMFRTDDKSSPALILQEEDLPTVEILGEGSEHWIKNNEAIGTAKASR